MKYCSHCGKELLDEAVICPSCGCKAAQNSNLSDENKKIMVLLIKIFMLLGCIVVGLTGMLLPFAWTIPMTIYLWNKLDKNEPVGMAFKICTLIFCSLVAGILLLCVDLEQDI